MSFSFFISILGSTFVIRNARNMIDAKLFRENEMTKIGTAYFAMVFLMSIVCARAFDRSAISMWICTFAPLALWKIVIEVLIARRTRNFRAQMPSILSLLLLKMKSGRSFRQALNETIAESDERTQHALIEVASVVAFSQQENARASDRYLTEIIDELTAIDRQPHLASRRLASFRDKLRIEEDFRRRSGQVLARIRAQSFVMTGLYLAVLVFMVAKFGWNANARVICLSIALFSVGIAWLWLGGRRLKWRV